MIMMMVVMMVMMVIEDILVYIVLFSNDSPTPPTRMNWLGGHVSTTRKQNSHRKEEAYL